MAFEIALDYTCQHGYYDDTCSQGGPMAKNKASIGDRELDLLRWIEERGDATVGEAVDGFGERRGLARSTVLTMMERLRRKRHLARRSSDGVYRYRATIPARELVRRAVAEFVEETLGGSVAPFVSYLAEREKLDERQVAELERLLQRLRARRGGERS
jgi:predicted transcriptional regulator